MSQSHQLYRTNIFLGGQMKYDLIVNKNGTIDTIHITPVVDNTTPYNRYTEEDLLNYTNQENIKKFYNKTQGSFYNTFVDTTISGEYPMIPNPSRADGATKNYDDSTFMGCSRMKYSLYNKQFQLFLPVWLETKFDEIKFNININTPQGIGLVSKEIRFSDRVKKYFDDYFKFIDLDDKILKVDFDGDCTVHGLNVTTGNMVTCKDFNLVENLTSRERPLIEFNSMIINTLKNRSIIAKQLFNFNLCFNVDDITGNDLEIPPFESFNINGNVLIDSKKLEIKDFFTNFDEIPRVSVTALDSDSLQNGEVIYRSKLQESSTNKSNVLDYKKDNTNIDIININKIDQKYIHWSLYDNNEYIFNLYDGWGGLYITPSEKRYFSHTYKTSPNNGINGFIQDMNTIYWCNYVSMSTKHVERVSTESILKACNGLDDNNYLNFIKYKQPSLKDGIYKSLLINIMSDDCFDIFDNKFKDFSNDRSKDYQYFNMCIDKNVCIDENDKKIKLYLFKGNNTNPNIYYFIFVSLTDMYLSNKSIVNMLKGNVTENFENVFEKAINKYVNIYSSVIPPKLITFNKSIMPVRCDGPEQTTTETTYFKVDNNYKQYVFRYDGDIKPTFIDVNSDEYNLIYYKDVYGVDKDEIPESNDPGYERYSVYKKYMSKENTNTLNYIPKYPPKYPSIQYYPLTSKKLEYCMSNEDIEHLISNLCDKKWFESSILVVLPTEINLKFTNDGSKTSLELFNEHIENYIKSINAAQSDNIKTNIEFILSLYNILSDIKLSNGGHEYTYEIHATLK